ncbi:transposase [Streptomyces malaysiensis]|uniref:Transposase n=1 Tax=Streptomyces malaysiensis TaxID=92644 RepID=A0A7X5WWF6_STRMQ|nr:transposase [Streptomyces malaysiensis]
MRAEPTVFGPVASGPTVSRLIGKLAAGGQRVLAALCTARVSPARTIGRVRTPSRSG